MRNPLHRIQPIAIGLGAGLAALSSCYYSTPRVWTSGNITRKIESQAIEGVVVETANGAVTVRGSSETQTPEIHVAKKGGGSDEADAQACLEAIEIVSEIQDGVLHLGWKWKTARQDGWAAQVDFEVTVPSDLEVSAKSHNGRIQVSGIHGDTNLVTHNGAIGAWGIEGAVKALTHNGEISVEARTEDLRLVTSNGAVRANLKNSPAPAGELRTHNGAIEVTLDPASSVQIDCSTANGHVRSDLVLSSESRSGRRLSGILGQGGGTLRVETSNGSIHLD